MGLSSISRQYIIMAIIIGTPTISASQTIAHTVGAGTKLLVVGISGKTSTNWLCSATWNGVAMTKQKEEDGGGGDGGATIFILEAPDTGTHDVVITTSGSGPSTRAFVIDLQDTNDTQDGATQSNWTSHVPSNSVTTIGVNGLVFDVRIVANAGPYTIAGGQTLLYNVSNVPSGYTVLASYKEYISPGSVNLAWSGPSAQDTELLAEIKGIAAAVKSNFIMLM